MTAITKTVGMQSSDEHWISSTHSDKEMEDEEELQRHESKSKTKDFNKQKYHYDPYLPPCRVCGAKASGSHFGAITCEACKVFFRRSFERKRRYKCKKQNGDKEECCITSERRGCCSFCRLKKCRHLGMDLANVQKGRYTVERKTECILEANEAARRLGQQPLDLTSSLEKLSNSPMKRKRMKMSKRIGEEIERDSDKLQLDIVQTESSDSQSSRVKSMKCDSVRTKEMDVDIYSKDDCISTDSSPELSGSASNSHTTSSSTDEPIWSQPNKQTVLEYIDIITTSCSAIQTSQNIDSTDLKSNNIVSSSSLSRKKDNQGSGINPEVFPNKYQFSLKIDSNTPEQEYSSDVTDSMGDLLQPPSSSSSIASRTPTSGKYLKLKEKWTTDHQADGDGTGSHSPIDTTVFSESEDMSEDPVIQHLVQLRGTYSLMRTDEAYLKEMRAREWRYKETVAAKESIFGPLKPIKHQVYCEIYSETGIDVDNRRQQIQLCIGFTDRAIVTYLDYLKRLPGFKGISIEDQMNMCRSNIVPWFLLSSYESLNVDLQIIHCIVCDQMHTRDEMIKFMSAEGIEDYIRGQTKLQKLKLTRDELALVSALQCFTQDCAYEPLRNADYVQKHYDWILEKLLNHLREYRERPMLYFAKIVDALTDLQSTVKAYRKMIVSYFTDYRDIHKPVLFSEMCQSLLKSYQDMADYSGEQLS